MCALPPWRHTHARACCLRVSTVPVQVELDSLGAVVVHPPSAWSDPSMRVCGHMPHWRGWVPTDAQLLSPDRGLTLPNSERLRTTEWLGNGRFRVQSRFHFRPNISSYPFEQETFRFELQTRAVLTHPQTGEALDVMLCEMPEYTTLAPNVDWPGTTNNRRLSLASTVSHTCEAPFQRSRRVCEKPLPDSSAWEWGPFAVPAIFRYESPDDCPCSTVPQYNPSSGLDLETCGCLGGVPAGGTFQLSVIATASRAGAFQSECFAPFLIVLISHTSYAIAPNHALDTRFNLLNSALIALVLYHAAIK